MRRGSDWYGSGINVAARLADRAKLVDQGSEGDRVVSRWVMTGSNRGRHAEMRGITISRIAGGHIVEDWSALDSLELLRQLGLVRTLLAAPRLLRAVRA